MAKGQTGDRYPSEPLIVNLGGVKNNPQKEVPHQTVENFLKKQ